MANIPGAGMPSPGFFFSRGKSGTARVAVLIDGSNLLGALGRAGLGYPALMPLLTKLVADDQLVFARFYGAPPPHEPYKGYFRAMQRANRHLPVLEFVQGYRKATGEEKCIDVAMAVDLVVGATTGRFDRVEILTGDGDLLYPIQMVHRLFGSKLRVHLMPGQPNLAALGQAHIPFTRWTEGELRRHGIADHGAHAPVPIAAQAPRTAAWTTPVLKGAFATRSKPRFSF